MLKFETDMRREAEESRRANNEYWETKMARSQERIVDLQQDVKHLHALHKECVVKEETQAKTNRTK